MKKKNQKVIMQINLKQTYFARVDYTCHCLGGPQWRMYINMFKIKICKYNYRIF